MNTNSNFASLCFASINLHFVCILMASNLTKEPKKLRKTVIWTRNWAEFQTKNNVGSLILSRYSIVCLIEPFTSYRMPFKIGLRKIWQGSKKQGPKYAWTSFSAKVLCWCIFFGRTFWQIDKTVRQQKVNFSTWPFYLGNKSMKLTFRNVFFHFQ